MDLVPRRFVHAGVSPVGRLDLETSGLLILTNDGDLANRIAHPRYECAKTYLARVSGSMSDSTVERLRRGVELEDGPSRPADLELLERNGAGSLLRIVLTEGRKRQVRRITTSRCAEDKVARTRESMASSSASSLRQIRSPFEVRLTCHTRRSTRLWERLTSLRLTSGSTTRVPELTVKLSSLASSLIASAPASASERRA